MQSLESAFGKALHQPMPFTTGGQTITDRLTAAKHSLAGSQLGKTICKATTEELMAPKKKHCDYLLHCTNEPNVSIPSMANLLIERTQNPNWIVIYKALITIHNLMCYGNERFSQYLASCNTTINLSGFLDKSTMQTSAMAAGYDMSTHVRRYAKYISEKIHTYRLCAFDFCKVKRGREDGLLRTMHADQLLKTLPILQNQIDALLEFQVSSSELNNGVINCSFILLFRDLIRLFACYNDGVINLLEKFFDMNKKQCREALDMYKAFLFRLDKVSDFLRVAETVGIDRGEIPDLTRAPASLLEALEAHLYHLEGGKGAPPTSSAQQMVSQQIYQQNESLNAFTQSLNSGGGIDELAKQKYLEEEKERLRQYEEQRQKQLQQNPQQFQQQSIASNPFGTSTPSATSGNPADLLSFYDSPAQQQTNDSIGASNPFASALFNTHSASAPLQSQPNINPFMGGDLNGGNPTQTNSAANPFSSFGSNTTNFSYNQTSGIPPQMFQQQPPMQSQPPFGQFPPQTNNSITQQPSSSRSIYDQTPFGPPQPTSTAADSTLSNLVGGLRISGQPPQQQQMPQMYQQQPQMGGFMAGYPQIPQQQQQPWNAFGGVGAYNTTAGAGYMPTSTNQSYGQTPNFGGVVPPVNNSASFGLNNGSNNFVPQQQQQ